MSRFYLYFLFLWCGFSAISQLPEPDQGQMSREDYIVMLIDSLKYSEQHSDTAEIIRYSAILTTQFQSARMHQRAEEYLRTSIFFATNYSNQSYFSEVCNRAGMFVYTKIRQFPNGVVDSTQYFKMLDSTFYWFNTAISSGLVNGKLGTVGWGYRGLLQTTVKLNEFDLNKGHDAPQYYSKSMEYALATGDEELVISTHSLYIGYCLRMNNQDTAFYLIDDLRNRLSSMKNKQKLSYYLRLHDYLATVNNLDTLITVRKLTFDYFRDVTAAEHSGELYEKDQLYEVSKTKKVLSATEDQLSSTSMVLYISLGALLIISLLLAYVYLVLFKNKKLSKRNELLLKEQNHRVKNNLQMISSLLSLQSQKLLSTDAKNALSDSQLRVNSVALLHRMLYEGEQIGQINLREYLKTLVEEIRFSAHRIILAELDINENLSLKIEQSTSLGLIINELITNSAKHIPDEVEVKIQLTIKKEVGKLLLSYHDNGPGVDPDVWKRSESFGNQLIRIQSEQLRGDYQVSLDNGFSYELRMAV
ncbi:MAG: sensor histidine kinase [Marinoscillum sp.]